MYNPKPEVYETLKALGYSCSQGRQAVFEEDKLPAITFTLGNKTGRYELDKTARAYDVEVVVDVWGNESAVVSRVAGEAEAAMLEIDYLLTYCADIPPDLETEGSLYHIQMRFGAIKESNL